MNGGPAGVLLDVDGTLIDSNYLHTLAWWRGLRDVGEWAPMNAVHRLIGMGGEQLVDELFARPVPGAKEAWRRRYDEIAGDATVFPGAVELVHRLSELGLRVVLATSAPADLLQRALDLLGIEDVLTATTDSDDVSTAKPEPDVFTTALAAGGIATDRALVVGDSIWDVRAARAAGLGCVALETGGFSRHELLEDGALAVYRDPVELCAQLRTSPIGLLIPAL